MKIKMTKQKLMDYIDACESIKEIESNITRISRKEVVHDKVSGSNPDFPYQPQSFNVAGVIETRLSEKELEQEIQNLKERRQQARKIKSEVDQWLNTIPIRMQRIVRYKFFERLSWEQAAQRIGKATENSLKKEFERFMKNN